MRVTRLEIFGFKSFVERFVLNFDENIIGVVGPNGCGKSNIVDSLRWVLGETHAKQLRGKSLEDLIFNGSESRRPLGMAEVSITIRPDEGWTTGLEFAAPESSDSQQTSPTGEPKQDVQSAEASGQAKAVAESENNDSPALLNGAQQAEPEQSAEAGDSDTSDTEEQSEEESDEPDEEIANQARNIIPQSLMQIPGLFDAAEIQLTRRLYRSGESEYFINRVPCRLRDMADIYRLIGLGARGLSIVQQGQIGQLISKKPTERRELLEEAAGISGFRARMEAAQRKLDRTSDNMARIADIILEVEKQVRVLKRQAARARARNELKETLSTAELELFSLKAATILKKRGQTAELSAQLEQELEELRARMTRADAEQGELQAQMEAVDVELQDFRRRRDELYRTLNRERERVKQSQVELARLEGKERATEESFTQIAESREQLAAEINDLVEQCAVDEAALKEVEQLRADAEQALRAIEQSARQAAEQEKQEQSQEANPARAAEIQSLSQEVEALQSLGDEIRRREREIGSKRGRVNQFRDALHRVDKELAATEREQSSLREQLQAIAEHVQQSTTAEDGSGSKDGVALASALRIPPTLQRAAAAILGDRAGYLISGEPERLGHNYLARKSAAKGGKVKRIGVIDGREHHVAKRLLEEPVSEAPSAKHLLDAIEVDEARRPTVEVLLGRVLLTDTLAEAFALNTVLRERHGVSEREWLIVTQEGEVVTPWGWYTTEGSGVGLSFARRIEELDGVLKELRGRRAEVEEQQRAAQAEVENARNELNRCLSERDRLIGLQKKIAILLREEKEEERKRREIALAEERKRREIWRQKEREAEGELRRAGEKVASARSTLEYRKRKIADVEREKENLKRREQQLQEEQKRLAAKKESVRQALSTFESDEAKQGIEAVQGEYEQVIEAVTEVEKRRDAISLQLGEASQKVSTVRKSLDALNSRETSTKVELERYAIELGMLQEELTRQYGEEQLLPGEDRVEEILSAATPDAPTRTKVLQEEAQKLRRRLEREGEVDPQAIEQYETEQARLDAMQEQYTDLQAAAKILEKTIRHLKEISRIRFVETFKDVSAKFSELVPRLFGGGAGSLTLVNPEDPLTSGVEISVRPPGKRITSMELMSGGEKALVATAVLISMFLHKPSPICVLDEVDAPLDDANLERFLNLITEIADRTQFLIITHNKDTMRAADRLLGITMQESGVSTALSVTLAEAEEEIERWAANA